MSTAITAWPQRTAPFTQLSAAWQQRLEREGRRVRFELGQPLSDLQAIADRVYVLLEGNARLVGEHRGSLNTLARLGPGEVVGLASLLRAAPCELVTAGAGLEAIALPDALVLELYQNETEFRRWCNQHLWQAEVFALARVLWEGRANSSVSVLKLHQQLLDGARLLPLPGSGSENGHPELADNERLFLASGNVSGASIGQSWTLSELPPNTQGPLPVRLIAVLDTALEQAIATRGESSHGSNQDSGEEEHKPHSSAIVPTESGPLRPTATALNLGQRANVLGFPVVRGRGALEESLALMQMLARRLEVPFRRDALERVVREAIGRGHQPNLQLLARLSVLLTLHPIGVHLGRGALTRLQTPSVVPWGEGGFALVLSSDGGGLVLASPRDGLVQLPAARIEEAFPAELDVLIVDKTITTQQQTFGFSWFGPAIMRHRAVLVQVLVASFVVQLFTLANPLLIQVIIDKVINQRSLDTLQVLGIALVVITLLEGVLSSLRTFLFTETTNRIDMRLGAEVIDHLLRLPLQYYDRRPVGELSTRIGEMEKIRNFLTGQALTTIIDAAFSVIYIAVMAFYSWALTLVALFVVPIQVGITVLGAPLFRRQFRRAAEENAQTQSHLVEVLTGIQTVKAQNVEMVSRWKWQDSYSRYISRSFEKMITGTALNQTGQVLQKVSQLLVLWVGASLVLEGELTLGQLIAFRIISGYVTQPLLRLSGIWQNLQELRVSFERLGDVVDTPEESDAVDQGKVPLPPVQGRVQFEDVCFRFNPGSARVLKNVNLEVPAGSYVGVVGQSGSGKSTLMKLLSRLYSPESGRILIDGYDIDKVELYSLRRQIGIVPQDPLLFSGTVSENIALSDPDASSEQIVWAATLAGAHEFIMELPAGYSTNVGERGSNLSGGQRQRIAIARTLLSRPRMLVMDEATSALDYDTERKVCLNLHDNLSDCTVFFITHRLSTIRRADVIVMMDRGSIAEIGNHDQLMQLQGRYYALYRQQEGIS